MIKLGITERGPRCERALQREAAHKGWWPFAFTLLQDIEVDYTPDDEPLIERLYSALSAGEGVHKITRRHRFGELDDWLAIEIERRFAGADSVVIHDMAASNGITSLELFDRIQANQSVEVHASDFYDRLLLVPVSQTPWTVIFDVERQPLQAVGGRFVISLRRDELKRHPANRLVQSRVRRTVLPQAQQSLDAWQRAESKETERSRVHEVSLFHPLCQRRSTADRRLQLCRHNVFEPVTTPCDVVRVMNALTPHHFETPRLLQALSACIQSVRPGGLFVIGRSVDEEDSRTAASVYERTADGLDLAWELNGGYEWAGLISQVVGDVVQHDSGFTDTDQASAPCAPAWSREVVR